MWAIICYFSRYLIFSFSGRLVSSAHRKSLRITCGWWISDLEKLEIHLKLVKMVGWIWKLAQMSRLVFQTCLLCFVGSGLLFFEKINFFIFGSTGMLNTTDVWTSVPNMFVKFCGQQFLIFRKKLFFSFLGRLVCSAK